MAAPERPGDLVEGGIPMRKAPVAAALALLFAAALPVVGSGRDCSKLTEAQVQAKSDITIYKGSAPATYRVCVCDAEPVVELVADGKVVATVAGGQCGEATGTRIEVHASNDRGVTVGYTVVTPAR
jgi:hypothetical protein